MNFDDVVKNRRSARKFTEQKISDETIFELIEAARLAPSGGNGQAHFFGVVKDEERKKELALAAGGQMWIAKAPLIIACCAYLDEDISALPDDDFGKIVNRTRFGDELIEELTKIKNKRATRIFWTNAAPLIPGEHIFLKATSLGLSACWVGFMDIERTSTILGLTEDQACFFLMPIGYAAEQPQPIERKQIEDLIFFEKYDLNQQD